MMESNLWAAYTITYGNLWLIFKRPMFIIILLLAIVTFCTPVIKAVLKKKKVKSGVNN
jgi:TctA family transporter